MCVYIHVLALQFNPFFSFFSESNLLDIRSGLAYKMQAMRNVSEQPAKEENVCFPVTAVASVHKPFLIYMGNIWILFLSF